MHDGTKKVQGRDERVRADAKTTILFFPRPKTAGSHLSCVNVTYHIQKRSLERRDHALCDFKLRPCEALMHYCSSFVLISPGRTYMVQRIDASRHGPLPTYFLSIDHLVNTVATSEHCVRPLHVHIPYLPTRVAYLFYVLVAAQKGGRHGLLRTTQTGRLIDMVHVHSTWAKFRTRAPGL